MDKSDGHITEMPKGQKTYMAKAERNCVVTKSERAPRESDDQPPHESDRPPRMPTTEAITPAPVSTMLRKSCCDYSLGGAEESASEGVPSTRGKTSVRPSRRSGRQRAACPRGGKWWGVFGLLVKEHQTRNELSYVRSVLPAPSGFFSGRQEGGERRTGGRFTGVRAGRG